MQSHESDSEPKTIEEALASPVIVCAAVRQAITGLVITGPRHFDATMWAQIIGIPLVVFKDLQRTNSLPPPDARHQEWAGAEEGFIDQHGNFYTREEAWALVVKNGQRLARPRAFVPGQLYSENLY